MVYADVRLNILVSGFFRRTNIPNLENLEALGFD
jgi:hypothetical protein